eukprot:7051281-Prymnesium_polylepis.1
MAVEQTRGQRRARDHVDVVACGGSSLRLDRAAAFRARRGRVASCCAIWVVQDCKAVACKAAKRTLCAAVSNWPTARARPETAPGVAAGAPCALPAPISSDLSANLRAAQ